MRNLGKTERIVLIIALGVSFEAFGSYFVPLSTVPFSSYAIRAAYAGPPGPLRVVVWIVLATAWAASSIAILRASPK